MGRGLVLFGGLCGVAGPFLPWIDVEGRQIGGLDTLAISGGVVESLSPLLGPGPLLILLISLMNIVLGITILKGLQPRALRRMARIAVALGVVVVAIVAYYAISLSIPPHRVLLLKEGFAVTGPGSGLSVLGVGMLVAAVGGVLTITGGVTVVTPSER